VLSLSNRVISNQAKLDPILESLHLLKDCCSIKVMGSEDHIKSQLKPPPVVRVTLLVVLSIVVLICFGIVSRINVGRPKLTQLNGRTASKLGIKIDTANYSRCIWKSEPLQGSCDVTKSTEESRIHTTAQNCETSCCESNTCISFQFRAKDGCLWGGDTRLGGEKDGPSAWCEPRPPAVWHGQWVKIKNNGDAVPGSCTNEGWNPNELNGQCFGLGSKKPTSRHTPQACRDACCVNKDCNVWQWRKDAGCFFNDNAFNCQQANQQDFEPFFGKRKVQGGRTYSPYAYSGDFADMAENYNVVP
jgi:hypothetical protein